MRNFPIRGGIAISWVMYGSSNHIAKPDGLVIENYSSRADDSYMKNIKTIGNPRLMRKFMTPHYPLYQYGTCNANENGKAVRSSLDFNKSVKQ